MLIDWGQEQGLTPGARFAIYRDVGVAGVPLASVGEGVVISTSSDDGADPRHARARRRLQRRLRRAAKIATLI